MLKVKISGIEEVRRALRERREEIFAAMDEAVKATAGEVQSTARGLAPSKSGALRSGIIIDKYTGAKEGVVVWDVGMDPSMTPVFRKAIQNPKGKRKDAYYPTVIEFGTSRIAARPFLRPAKDKGKGALKNNVTKAVKAVVDRDY